VIFLGEVWNAQLIFGMSIMTIGLILAATNTNTFKRNWPIWVLLLPLGASLGRGIIQPIVKAGLLENPSPFLATLILGSTSSIMLTVILIITGKYKLVGDSFEGFKWFSISGIINALGILSIMYAVNLGGVTLAAPLVATSPIWALLFGYVIFRNEALGPRHLFVSSLVVIGSILIVLR
jgi:drug/metabolite transporter (DMT)-like permease